MLLQPEDWKYSRAIWMVPGGRKYNHIEYLLAEDTSKVTTN